MPSVPFRPHFALLTHHLILDTFCIMPPQRIRNAFDDSRSEASSSRDKQPISTATGISKVRRNGTSTLAGSNLKDITNAQTIPNGQQGDTAVSVRIRCMASDQVIILIATPLDFLAVFRYFCAPCLSLRPSSRYPSSLYLAIQPKNAYKTGHWTAFSHNGTASCTSTYWQRRSGSSSKEGLQCCHSS